MVGGILIRLMALELNDAHIVSYYMNAAWSVALVQNNFAHRDCFVVQSWIHATLLYQDMINHIRPHIY